MEIASVLVGVAGTLGVFAVAVVFIRLIYRGVELELVSGRQSRLASMMGSNLFVCVNAWIHIDDEERWYAVFWVVLAVVCVALSWREWRRERASLTTP